MPDSARSLRTFSEPLGPYELKFRPALIDVLAQCHEQRPVLTLHQNFQRVHARVAAAFAHDEIQFEECTQVLTEGVAVVDLQLNDTHFRLHGTLERRSVQQFSLRGLTLFQMSRRGVERIPLAPDTVRLSVGTVTDGAPCVQRLPVRDLSVDGVNVADQPGATWVDHGLTLPAVLEADGEIYE